MTQTQFTPEELDEIYRFAVDLGKQAGQRLLNGANNRVKGLLPEAVNSSNSTSNLAFTEKDNAVDIVTQVDEGSNAIHVL
jgi:myo-inositol-1(or 4)-monophosphatase